MAKHLEACGVTAASIHGDKSQPQREKALAAFKAGQVRALVATDIAARGIDVEAVSHVVQFELPNVPEAYVHRIGRTARAGADGMAVALCADDERNLLRDIQRVTRQTIPTQDRRRDPGLAVMAKATKAQELARGPEPRAEAQPARKRPDGERSRQPHRQRRTGGGGGNGQAGGRAAGAPAQAHGHGQGRQSHDGGRPLASTTPIRQPVRPQPQAQSQAQSGEAPPKRSGSAREARWNPAD